MQRQVWSPYVMCGVLCLRQAARTIAVVCAARASANCISWSDACVPLFAMPQVPDIPATAQTHTMASAVEIATYSAKRLALSMGKALWLASTTVLVLVLPLVIEMDREQQLVDMEKEQMGVLTGKAA